MESHLELLTKENKAYFAKKKQKEAFTASRLEFERRRDHAKQKKLELEALDIQNRTQKLNSKTKRVT